MDRRRIPEVLIGLAFAAWLGRTAFVHACAASSPAPNVPPPPRSLPQVSSVAELTAAPSAASAPLDRPIALPGVGPARVPCVAARRVVGEVRARFVGDVKLAPRDRFARDLASTLDPHGLWSAAPDARSASVVRREAEHVLEEIERAPEDDRPCAAATRVGETLRAWVTELRAAFSAGERRAASATPAGAVRLARAALYQDDPVTRPALELAGELGARLVTLERALPASAATRAAARARQFPELGDEAWAEVVLGAALATYVPLVDPHGAWAPLDADWSLYDDGLGPSDDRLWSDVERTAAGFVVISGARAPLVDGDLVLEVAGIPTAGLGLDQVEQLAHAESLPGDTEITFRVLHKDADAIADLSLALPDPDAEPEPSDVLESERVRYGAGFVRVVRLADVHDGLGEALGAVVGEASGDVGIVLDLRGNGGGSVDGASGALGVFLPGAPLFPERGRAGSVEVERAAAPPPSAQWTGPVAVIVDGFTASAAEMIAGALGAYARGPVLGSRTFGKGCIQETFDDRGGVGVLRLTTLLYALPSGVGLQHVGVTPDVELALAGPWERERNLLGSPAPWSGPDVRDTAIARGPTWPRHDGQVGPCADASLCRALRRLGEGARSARAAAAPSASSGRAR